MPVDLSTLLNTVSTIALVGALIFAGFQVRSAYRVRSEQAAIAVINTAQSEAWTRALHLLHDIPPNATVENIDSFGDDTVRAIEEIGIRLETIGYMVFRRIASIQMVD